VFDQNSFGKLKLIGALLDQMDLLDAGRLAVMYLNDTILNATSTTYNDTEGLINLPLTAREIQAVIFFKLGADGDIHVSMRSKYDVDVRAIAARHGGGGHKNAAGFKLRGPLSGVRDGVLQDMTQAIALGVQTKP
jgi:phosphoesterase RecJ-like protein